MSKIKNKTDLSSAIYGIHSFTSFFEKHPQDVNHVYVQDNYASNVKLNNIVTTVQQHKIALTFLKKKQFDEMTSGANHQGVLAEVELSKNTLHERELEEYLSGKPDAPFLLILDQIQDPHNLGACIRSAAAAGVDAIIAPKDGSVAITTTVHKTACGGTEHVPYVQVTNLVRTMKHLQTLGVWITGTRGDATSSLYDIDFKGPTAIVIGGEGKGMRRLVTESCDYLANIPLSPNMESLNASVAAGICLFEVVRQRQD